MPDTVSKTIGSIFFLSHKPFQNARSDSFGKAALDLDGKTGFLPVFPNNSRPGPYDKRGNRPETLFVAVEKKQSRTVCLFFRFETKPAAARAISLTPSPMILILFISFPPRPLI
jgi:hypothetical protein